VTVRASFERDGYVVVDDALSPQVVRSLRDHVAAAVDRRAADWLRTGRIRCAHTALPFEERYAAVAAEAGEHVFKWGEILFGRALYDALTAPGLVAALTDVLGPDVTFHGDQQLTPKFPGSAQTAFPWHQDTWYYGEPSKDLPIVTAWVPLVPADETNGCLWVLPGSHRWGLLPATRGADRLVRCDVPVETRATPRPVPLKPGSVLLLTNLTFHASAVNRGTTTRWSIDLGFSAPVAPGSPPATARSARYVFDALARQGRFPLRVAGPAGPEPFAVWAARHDRNEGVTP
jgi:ectoine hydroxylase-related dioxygenase (phytanoyl-CoA dioxygenase family)